MTQEASASSSTIEVIEDEESAEEDASEQESGSLINAESVSLSGAENEEGLSAMKDNDTDRYMNFPPTFPVSDAVYLTEDMIVNRAKEVLDYAEAHKYIYGDSHTLPPCLDGVISCDRLTACVLWSYGFTDQAKGGIVVDDPGKEFHDLSLYLTNHGFVESKGKDAIKRGSIVIVTDVRGNWKGHAFITADVDGTELLADGSNIMRYDSGDCWKSSNADGTYPEEPVAGWIYPTDDDTIFVYNLPEPDAARFSKIYDFEYYMAHYPTVREITGGDSVEALRFFLNYGIDAGHQGCAEFNVAAYRESLDNPSLYGENLRSYYYMYLLSE